LVQDEKVEAFLSSYNEEVYNNAQKLREILFANLPDIIEQVDLPARMIAYCYGQKYIEMICTIIPSKKGIKLGLYRGVDLPDPENLLKGTGKISRYIEIKSQHLINSKALQHLILSAWESYKQRMKNEADLNKK